MTATLTFQLPEEQELLQVAVDGGKWRSAVSDMDQWLRRKVKHGEGDVSDYEDARRMLCECLASNGLSIYD
jgi:hypothetical protein